MIFKIIEKSTFTKAKKKPYGHTAYQRKTPKGKMAQVSAKGVKPAKTELGLADQMLSEYGINTTKMSKQDIREIITWLKVILKNRITWANKPTKDVFETQEEHAKWAGRTVNFDRADEKKMAEIGKLIGHEPEVMGGGVLGFVFALPAGTLAFGYENGPLGHTFFTTDGKDLSSGDMDKEDASVEEQANYIKETLANVKQGKYEKSVRTKAEGQVVN